MSQAIQLPTPNITVLNQEEKEKIDERISELMSAQDIPGLAKMVEIYPLSAKTLDSLKKYLGLNALLQNNFNLVNAVEVYGEEWLRA